MRQVYYDLISESLDAMLQRLDVETKLAGGDVLMPEAERILEGAGNPRPSQAQQEMARSLALERHGARDVGGSAGGLVVTGQRVRRLRKPQTPGLVCQHSALVRIETPGRR